MDTPLYHLRNLLARIHRDGGEYTAKHGIEKSVADADQIVADLFMLSDTNDEGRYDCIASRIDTVIDSAKREILAELERFKPDEHTSHDKYEQRYVNSASKKYCKNCGDSVALGDWYCSEMCAHHGGDR